MMEIDFLWVGEESKTGDAIGCRFTHPDTGASVVVLIDGGFTETDGSGRPLRAAAPRPPALPLRIRR